VSKVRIDLQALYEALGSRRTLMGASWRGVAAMAGVSATALSRLANGHGMSADGFASLVSWLELPAEAFFRSADEPVGPTGGPAEGPADRIVDEVVEEYLVAVTVHCSTEGVHEQDAAASAVRAVQIAVTRAPLSAELVNASERPVRLLAVTELGQAFRDGVLRLEPFTPPGARVHR
jgi:transcriptional regulator with XRE-family HTH domain